MLDRRHMPMEPTMRHQKALLPYASCVVCRCVCGAQPVSDTWQAAQPQAMVLMAANKHVHTMRV